ncbi:MAG: hypothetical protein V5783_04275 [Pontiella sp.]
MHNLPENIMRLNPNHIFLMLLGAGFLFSPTVFADEMVRVDLENGPLENLQVILLFLSAIAFLRPVYRAERSYRCVLLGGAMLCFSFILRELDVEDLAVPHWVISMGSGPGRDVLLGTGWVLVVGLSIKSFAALKQNLKSILFSRTTALIVSAGLVLFSGSFFDHKDNKTTMDQLAEEIIEGVGYGIFLLGAILSRSTARTFAENAEEPHS